jgi:hypothetical protein
MTGTPSRTATVPIVRWDRKEAGEQSPGPRNAKGIRGACWWERKLAFLGFTFTTHYQPKVRESLKSLKRFKDKIRFEFRKGRGRNPGAFIKELGPILRGWMAYYRKAEVKAAVTTQAPGPRRAAMGRLPSGGGRIKWAKPIRPRFWSASDKTELRQKPWGQARQGRGGEAPELSQAARSMDTAEAALHSVAPVEAAKDSMP